LPKKWGSIPSRGTKFFLVHVRQITNDVQACSFAKGAGGFLPYIKYLRHDAECSAVSKAEVKNGCSYTSPPPPPPTKHLHGMVLIKH